MKKEIVKKIKKGNFYVDRNCNWRVVTNNCLIYDKQFSKDGALIIKNCNQVKKLFDILEEGFTMEGNSNSVKVIFKDNTGSSLTLKGVDTAYIKDETYEGKFKYILDKELLGYAYSLRKDMKPDAVSDIKDYIGFLGKYIYRTDTYQLGCYISFKEVETPFSLNEEVLEILEIIGEETVNLEYTESIVKVETKDYIIISHNYSLPNCSGVISNTEDKEYIPIRFNSKELSDVLKVCDKIAVDNISQRHSVVMSKSKHEIEFESQNSDMTIQKYITCLDKLEEDVKVKYNIKFLLNCISHFKEKEFTIYYKNEKTMLFSKKDNYKYIFMPMALD